MTDALSRHKSTDVLTRASVAPIKGKPTPDLSQGSGLGSRRLKDGRPRLPDRATEILFVLRNGIPWDALSAGVSGESIGWRSKFALPVMH
jgi:hypothetical protein